MMTNLSRVNCWCKGPKAGMHVAGLRDERKDRMTGDTKQVGD